MEAQSHFEQGWNLGIKSIQFVWQYPSLLLYPTIPMIFIGLISKAHDILFALSHNVVNFKFFLFEVLLSNLFHFFNIISTIEFSTTGLMSSRLLLVFLQFCIECVWIFTAALLVYKIFTQIKNIPLSLLENIQHIAKKKRSLLIWIFIIVITRMIVLYNIIDYVHSYLLIIYLLCWYFISFFVMQIIILNNSKSAQQMIFTIITSPFTHITKMIGGLLPISFFVGSISGFILLITSFLISTNLQQPSSIPSSFILGLLPLAGIAMIGTTCIILTAFKTFLWMEEKNIFNKI